MMGDMGEERNTRCLGRKCYGGREKEEKGQVKRARVENRDLSTCSAREGNKLSAVK